VATLAPDGGRETEGSTGVTVTDSTGLVTDRGHGHGRGIDHSDVDDSGGDGRDLSRRRFTVAAMLAMVVSAVPFVWILWGPYEGPSPLHQAISQTNFYDLQARAMFHGHLWVPNGRLGVEAFIHGGHQYTYFGLFPSLLRMPILLVTSSLDGKLTALSMLLAWLLTGLAASLLLWRVRVLIRGGAVLGKAEATSLGVLLVAIMGGSVFLTLAATPYVYNEDLAWSVCLTVASLFALLGVLERPSRARVVVSGLFILGANLDRVTTGWACVVGAVLISIWFGLGRGGPDNRRWFVPVLAAGLVPLAVGCAVNIAKFGMPFGISVNDQVYSLVNAYRQRFLAANHNSEVGTAFIPTNLVAYLRFDGLRFTSVFPFITLPASPNPELAGVLFDKRYRTASLPSSMPLLFLLSCWGLITAFRPRPFGRVALTRLPLLAAGTACAALMLWGYIAPRYLADFMPFLVLASAVAMVDVWRRMEGRTRPVRTGGVAMIGLVAVFSVVAGVGMSITPNEQWNSTQVVHYVEVQKAFSDLMGDTLQANVVKGVSLPPRAPADQLFIIGKCDGLYVSNGENYTTVPSQSFNRTSWMPVEYGHTFQHTFRVTFNQPGTATPGLGLVSTGENVVSVNVVGTPGRKRDRVVFSYATPGHKVFGYTPYVRADTTHLVQVITDPVKHEVLVSLDGQAQLAGDLTTEQPIVVDTEQADSGGQRPALVVTNITGSTPQPTICQSLDH
jgi:hypothetical protein